MHLLYVAAVPDAWLLKALRETGHHVSLATGLDGAHRQLLLEPAAVLVLDGGAEVLPWLLALSGPALIGRLALLTESAGDSRVALIQAGADACLQRPLQLNDIMASLERIEQGLARHLPGLTLSARRRTLGFNGASVELSVQEFQLLDYLSLQAAPVTGARLCQHLWGSDESVSGDALKALVYRLRTKLRRCTGQPLLASQRGAGYFLRPQSAPSTTDR